ncbi:ribosome recycling factor-domain-containing protein [Aspergillus pseudonomiae]|uniref:Ribosome recycling factor-domain-containing protein n=1 Tax=Aspergillus pseudonomiae TaxID=1506151 RepID=A0A5N6HST7_9EURO|nr:ribosome recycling factor-domain-containing protein [Aspergillus pseudonomiae]KAB8257561.1 ribosome recycling factor-domain-containing protein [Aspergillus pseudonomiae]KAE8408829.1 ribosome recycling factor-domain-containing protein [Aspergillus pseudonomiae]
MQRIPVLSSHIQRLSSSFTNVSAPVNLQRGRCWLLQERSLEVPNGGMAFSTCPLLFKKKDKTKSSSTSSPDARPLKAAVVSDDPYDLAQLHHGIAAAVCRLKDELSKLRLGGRLNTDAIENLRVQLSKGSKETLKLGDLAQVVPKGGRMVIVLVSEEDHIKPITSAVVSSDLSLTPQPDMHNSLQLNIPIPPPTKESRDQTVSVAKAAMERATAAVRDSRSSVHKRLQDMQKKKIARPDDVRKAQEQMEKATENGQREVRDLFEAAKKAMERA